MNASIGAILLNLDRFEKYSLTYPYFYGSLVFAIPYGKPYTPLEILFLPFKYRIWICLFVILLATLIVVGLIKTKWFIAYRSFIVGPYNNLPFLNMLAICLGNYMSHTPRLNFARTLVTIWLLMSLILKAAYQSKSFYFMQTIPRASPLYSLDSVYDSKLDLYLWPSLFQSFYDSFPMKREQ